MVENVSAQEDPVFVGAADHLDIQRPRRVHLQSNHKCWQNNDHIPCDTEKCSFTRLNQTEILEHAERDDRLVSSRIKLGWQRRLCKR